MRQKWCLIALLLLLLAGCATGPTLADKAKSCYRMAQSYVAAKDYTSALEQLQTGLKYDATDPDLHALLGQVYFLKKAYALSETHYKKSLQLRPDHPETQNNLAALYLDLQRWNEAAVLFRKAADNLLFRYPANALTGLGIAYYQSGDYLKAVMTFKEALADFPDHLRCLTYLAMTYQAMHKEELALAPLERTLTLAPDNNSIRLMYGENLMRLERLDDAREVLREVANREDRSALGQKAREFLILIEQ
ncbi:MAG: tetratricopeptide repeat protein [Desulfuromonadaceae bacterium]|nr:tetratricopeptide repeat protein [Desulfuromonadaceae bacterium]